MNWRIPSREPYAIGLILALFGLIGLVGSLSPTIDTFVTNFALALGVSPLLFSLALLFMGMFILRQGFRKVLHAMEPLPGKVVCQNCHHQQSEEIGRCERCGKIIHTRRDNRPASGNSEPG